jgi:WD40 repeat protein
MSVCPSKDLLEQLLAEALSDAERAAVEQHLAVCRPCVARLEALTSEPDSDQWRALQQQAPERNAAASELFLKAVAVQGLVLADTLELAQGLIPTPVHSAVSPEAAGQRQPQNGPRGLPDIPGYEVLEEIGRGGMGVVYRARQKGLNRLVALKMILTGVHASETEVARFRAEAETVARLEHPHIVQIHEIGTHAGQPYLCLEYVPGGSLDQRLNGTPQPPRQAAELCETLALAIQSAHEHRILHRDLKPSNILLVSGGVVSGEQSSGTSLHPKIADFGLARRLSENQTLAPSASIAGTPSYMAPEQALGTTAALDPTVDVYALGAILYEMLSGRPPFKAASPYDTLLQVAHQEPVPPRELQPSVPRDLETICLKCLRKEPAKRYASAGELAADLRAFLERRPIVARPVSRLERTVKWVRRRPAVAALLAALVLVGAVGFGLVVWQWSLAETRAAEERQAKEKERKARREIEHISANLWLDQGSRLCEQGEIRYGLLSLARALDLATRAGDANLERVARVGLASWRYQLIRERARLVYPLPAGQVVYSPDGNSVAIASDEERTVRRWNVADGMPLGKPLKHDWPVWAIAFSPNGRFLATGSGSMDDGQGKARLLDARTGKPTPVALEAKGLVHTLHFSADSRRLLTLGPQGAFLWETATGKLLWHFQHGLLQTAALSPDGKTVLTAGQNGSAQLWDVTSGKVCHELRGHSRPVLTCAFSPDGGRVVTAGADWSSRLWTTATGAQEAVLKQRGPVFKVAFSPDGRTLATGGMILEGNAQAGSIGEGGGEACLWETKTGNALGQPLPHRRVVVALAFNPSSSILLTGAKDNRARFFWVASGHLIGSELHHEGIVRGVAFAPDGKTACTTSGMGGDKYRAARLWEIPPNPSGRLAARHDTRAPYWVAYSPNDQGKALLMGGLSHQARLYDSGSGQPLGPILRHKDTVTQVAFSPDGRRLMTASDDHHIRFWDRATGRLLHQCDVGEPIREFAFQPGGQTFTTVGRSGAITHWDARTAKPRGSSAAIRKRLKALGAGSQSLAAVDFRPNGSLVFITVGRQSVQLWDAATDQLLLHWHQTGEIRACLSPDGKTLLLNGAVGNDNQTRIWDLATKKPKGPPLIHETVVALGFSPDGKTVVTGGWDNAARLWDVATGKSLGAPLWHYAPVFAAAFATDGRSLTTGSIDDLFIRWTLPKPLAGNVDSIRLWVESLTGMELDAEGAVRELSEEAVHTRRQRLRGSGLLAD